MREDEHAVADGNGPADEPTGESRTVGEVFLESLSEFEVTHVFANLGSDHAPILEAASRIEARGGSMPEIVTVPHESVALSAAHGYAMVTGSPQAVFVHVDIGTQNLGGAVHNAHRANIPVLLFAGLSPASESDHLGSRDSPVHYVQDVFDQPKIVEEYCKWVYEYRPPADPEAVVARALSMAVSDPQGPVYLTAVREALATAVEPEATDRTIHASKPTGADTDDVDQIVELIAEADSPLVITSKFGDHGSESAIRTLVQFAERSGAGVVEQRPAKLCFPRSHEQHVGFVPNRVFDHADLLLLVDSPVPWLPASGSPPDETTIVQIETDTSHPTYPYWDFPVDYTIDADPVRTLERVTSQLDATHASDSTVWAKIHEEQQSTRQEVRETHSDSGRLTPVVLSSMLDDIIDDSTTVLADAVTNTSAIVNHLSLSEPLSYYSKYGTGLGWAGGAGVGVKMAAPDRRVVSLVGDGGYLFSNPSVQAWLSAAQNAPTLTVIYNNAGWAAVKSAVERQHPEGRAMDDDVPASKFEPEFDLTAPAQVVDAHVAAVRSRDDLRGKLNAAVEAVDSGTPAVLDVKVEPIGRE